MNLTDTARMLAVITRAYGGMTLQEGQPQLWADLLSDLDVDDAMAGLRVHIQNSERIPTVADIRKQAKAVIRDRINRRPAITAPVRATDPGPEWAQTRAHLDELAARRKAKDAAAGDPATLGEMAAEIARRMQAKQDAQ